MKVLQQMRYLLYRNFMLKWRNRKQTMYELISVAYFVAILAVVRKTAIKPKTEPPVLDPSIVDLNVTSNKPLLGKRVGYVLKEGNSTAVVQTFLDLLHNKTTPTFVRFTSEEQLLKLYKKKTANVSMAFILSYDEASRHSTFRIRVPFDSLVETTSDKTQGADLCFDKRALFIKSSCPANSYLTSGFATLQSLLQSSFIGASANITGYENGISISAKMFPKAEFKTSLTYLQNIMSIYLVIAFSPYILFLLTNIVTEKEKKIKESMKIMGLKTYAFWLSWFITYAVFIGIGVIIVVVIAKVAELFGNSNYFLIFVILLLYGMSIETLSFMLTPLFNNARTAGMFGSVTTILLGLLSMIHIYVKTSSAVKWLTALLSPVALSLALVPAIDVNAGLTFDNVSTKGDFPAANGIVMLLIDTLLYLLLAVYLDLIFPGEYGHSEHPLFFLFPHYWRRRTGAFQVQRQPSLLRSSSVKDGTVPEDIEQVDERFLDMKAISINNVKKIFKAKKKDPIYALNGVSFDVYEGQITALLGHNGAGKSTLIATLTGMLTPTSGSATVYGLSTSKTEEMESIREMIGLCPQQNILIDQLTCREHLTVFAGIKGISPSKIKDMVETVLVDIDLAKEGDTCSMNLSGGQKRKLCVGIAIIGDPKILIFDEPTSGMDPASRRKIWSLLQKKRAGNVILLTTHFMDEADILADYKAIISKGKLRCAGSSLFLKNRFGVGYHLGMVLAPDCDRSKVIETVKECISTAEVSRSHGKELAFRLPLKVVDQFSGLFDKLESFNEGKPGCAAKELGIVSYGVSMTTLEEVFLKLEEEEPEPKSESENVSSVVPKKHLAISEDRGFLSKEQGQTFHTSSVSLDNNQQLSSGARRSTKWLAWQQFTALLEVRYRATLRSYMKLFFQVVVPPALLFASMMILRSSTSTDVSGNIKPLPLVPDLYVKQGSAGSSKLSKVVMKNSNLSNFQNMLDSFAKENLPLDMVASTSDLISIHPHAVAYNMHDIKADGKTSYQLRYNDTNVHSMPVGINIMYNVIRRLALANDSGSPNSMSVVSQPFPSLVTKFSYDATSFVSVMLMGLAFAVMCGGFSIEVVYWRQFGMRHLTRVSGTSRLVYWLVFLVGDLLMYTLMILMAIILIFSFDLKAFTSPPAFAAFILLLILYIPMSLLFAYTLSFMFNKFETAMNVVGTIISIAALVPYSAVSNIDMTASDDEQRHVAYVIHIICLIIDPPYALLGGLYYVSRIYTVESIIARDMNVVIPSSKYFGWSGNNGLPPTLLITFLQLLLFGYLVAVLDHWRTGGVAVFPFSLLKALRCKTSRVARSFSRRSTASPISGDEEEMNNDVREEREKVMKETLEGNAKEKTVLLQGLSKNFGKKRVVKDLYLSVDQGEIFGMLGPNGAGKTTTLNIITADVPKTKGQVFVGGYDISSDLHHAHQSLGYCPQKDALWESITTREHLKCFALIKGVSRRDVGGVVQHYMDALKISEHADKKAKDLSGGTKRKLSFCMSMLGHPSVLMFDEPSTGMDPSSKRFLWTAISRNMIERGAILTTHSMEEADALCSRVGIIVKGSLKCIGSTQELKSNYGGGYQLEIKAAAASADESSTDHSENRINQFVSQLFPTSTLRESFGTRYTFKVPNCDVGSLAQIFSQLEDKKSSYGIEEYSFSQSSLEQVFLEFAREQDEDFTGKTEDVPNNGTVNS